MKKRWWMPARRLLSLSTVIRREIIFTSCGTESDSTAIRGTLGSYPDKRHMVTSRVEHPAVLNLVRHLSKNGYDATELPVDRKGKLDISDVEQAHHRQHRDCQHHVRQ